jgi:hypothetical protein
VLVRIASRRDIEEGLIDRHLLDKRRLVEDERHDLVGELAVAVEVAACPYRVGAELLGSGRRHGGMDAVLPCFIGGGRDDTAVFGTSSDNHGLATPGRMVELLD